MMCSQLGKRLNNRGLHSLKMNRQPKRRKYTDIPLTIEGNLKYVKGVTRYTTCADVIKMVIKKSESLRDENAFEAFGIYESSRGIERLLPARSRILKIIRSWGTDNNYNLVFRKVNTTFSAPRLLDDKGRKIVNRQCVPRAETKMDRHEPISPLNCIENHVIEMHLKDRTQINTFTTCTHADYVSSAKLNNLSPATRMSISRNVTGQSDNLVHKKITYNYDANDVKFAVKKVLKTKHYNIPQTSSPVEEKIKPRCRKTQKEHIRHFRHHEKLANHVLSKVSHLNQKDGKEALLQKYFADYITYKSPTRRYLDSRFRERGDGEESNLNVQIKCKSNKVSRANCVPENLRTNVTFTEIRDVSSDSGQDDDSFGLDTGFILDHSKSDSEISSEYKVPNVSPSSDDFVTDIPLAETRTCCPSNRLVEYSFSDDDASISSSDRTETDFHGEHINDVINDVSSVSDIVKGVFSENADDNEDDEMESFMKTKIFDETSDEGLSSLDDQDDEEEIMV